VARHHCWLEGRIWMKPEDLKEAVNLYAQYKKLTKQLKELETNEVLEITFGKRQATFTKEHHEFVAMKNNMATILEMNRRNVVRRGYQIGLFIESVIA
jgi:rubrerythrin